MEAELEKCRSLLQQGRFYFVHTANTLNAVLERVGDNQYILQKGSTINSPTKNQCDEFKILFDKTSKHPFSNTIFVLDENLSFPTQFSAATFVLGKSQNDNLFEFAYWSLINQRVHPGVVYDNWCNRIAYRELPVRLKNYADRIFQSCITAFLDSACTVCKTKDEMITQLIDLLTLFDEHFKLCKRMHYYVESNETVTFEKLLLRIKSQFLDDRMYDLLTYHTTTNQQQQFVGKLLEMQGREPECKVIKFIWKKCQAIELKLQSTPSLFSLLFNFWKTDTTDEVEKSSKKVL